MGEDNLRSTVVIGVDFGTLSGRALVVRAADGAELGSAVHEYRARRGRAPAARDRRGACRPSGRCRCPTTTATSCATRSRGARERPASRPSRSSGSRPTSPRRRRCRRWPTARRCASCPAWPTRPHAYAKLWKHHAAQSHADRINAAGGRARRAVARALRRPHLLGVGVREGAADARGGPRGLRAHRALDRGRRLDRLAAVRARDAQHVHRRLQGDLPGRRLSERGLPRRAQPGLRGLRGRQARAIRSRRWARARAA